MAQNLKDYPLLQYCVNLRQEGIRKMVTRIEHLIDLYPYWVLWFQLGSILLFFVIVIYLPCFMKWVDENA